MTITNPNNVDVDVDVDVDKQDEATALRLLVLEAFGTDEQLPVTELLARIATVNPGLGTNAAARSVLAEIDMTPFNTNGRRYYRRPAAEPVFDAPQLRAAVVAAFDTADRIEADELYERLGDIDPHLVANLAKLKSGLAEIGMTPENGPENERFYQRSAAIGPVPGGEQLLAALSGMVQTGRAWQAAANARAKAKRYAEQQRISRERASAAAGWWRRDFRIADVEPPMLTWVGYPLPDGRDRQGDQEADRIHALAFLGNGVFLAHRSRTVNGVEYSNTEHVGLVIAACGGCGQHHEHRVKNTTGLGDVLDLLAERSCLGNTGQHAKF
ncbi:hypothetical protein [Catenulispora rubra]|uniref:hypothetical protein n=1 Tax=Catenulispora rubra TaxID=280293 RepID=UPI00189247FC|nr:hypothetical protein [Catenulispora rubra]